MGADEDHTLWNDDTFLEKVREALQKDGIVLLEKRSSS